MITLQALFLKIFRFITISEIFNIKFTLNIAINKRPELKNKRTNWQLDFKHNKNIEFWYPDDILTWIPGNYHKTFLDEINNIENMWTEEQKDGSFLGFQEAIQHLDESDELVTQHFETMGLVS